MKIIEIASYSSIFILCLISVTLLTGKRGNRLPNRLLSLHLALRGAIILVAILAELHQLFLIKRFIWVVPLFQQLIPISTYYYIRANASRDYSISGKELLFLLPLLPTLLIYIYGSVFMQPISNQNLENLWGAGNSLSDVSLLAHRKFLMLYRNALYLIYGLYIWRIAKKHIINGEQHAKSKWVRSFIVLYFLYFVIGLAHTLIYLTADASVRSLMSMNLLKYTNIIAAYTLLYFIFKNPDVIYGHVFASGSISSEQEVTAVNESLAEPAAALISSDKELQKTNDIKLPDEKAAAYFEELSSYLTETKVFLKQDFIITDLSAHTRIPTSYISYSIGKIEQKNFREYINSLRIQYFIQQYEGQSGKYTIDTIAENSGFRSKATFYTAFKRQTGKTPADFFKSVENTDAGI